MSDTFITIMAVMSVALIMFIFPLMSTASQNDKITQETVDVIVADFVNTAAKEGKITSNSYDEFVQKLYATGNSYSIELEVQKFDDNPANKGTGETSKDVIGENIHYSEFTNDILKQLENSDDGVYELKRGDYIKVKVQNTNITFGTEMKNFIYTIIGKDTIAIETNSSALVLNSMAEPIVMGMEEPTEEEPPVVEEEEEEEEEETPQVEYISKNATIQITELEKVKSNIIFVIDITGSMIYTEGITGYDSRMDMVKANVKSFLQAIEISEENDDSIIIDVIRFGDISEIMTGEGLNTKSEVEEFLDNQFEKEIHHHYYVGNGVYPFAYNENYDYALEDAIACVDKNKTKNDKANTVIIITDGNTVFDSERLKHGRWKDTLYGLSNELVNNRRATVWAIGITTNTEVLKAMAYDKEEYCYQIGDNNKLTDILTNINEEISEKSVTYVPSTEGKIPLSGITDISASKPVTIKLSTYSNDIVVDDITNSGGLIEGVGSEYKLVLDKLAERVGGKEVLQNGTLEIYYTK